MSLRLEMSARQPDDLPRDARCAIERTAAMFVARRLLFAPVMRALLSSALLSCSLVLAAPSVHASTMDDVARFFGFGSDDSGSQGSVRHTTDVHVGSSETSEVSTRTRNDVALSHGAPVVTREAAPEIDAGALTSALALAAGGLVAIGVRRRRVRR